MTRTAPHAIYMCVRKVRMTVVLRMSGAWAREKINERPDRLDNRPEDNREIFTDDRETSDVRRLGQEKNITEKILRTTVRYLGRPAPRPGEKYIREVCTDVGIVQTTVLRAPEMFLWTTGARRSGAPRAPTRTSAAPARRRRRRTPRGVVLQRI